MNEGNQVKQETVSIRRCTRFRLASPSPTKSSGSDTESIHSWQGYETELVKDTSDTSSSSPTYFVEYDMTDTEEQIENFFSLDDTDDQEDVVELGPELSVESNDVVDIALLGDTSEEISTSPTSNSDVDPGLPRSDYLDFEKCLICQTDQKDISYPYCSTCFKWKKNLFPSRPKKRQKITKKNLTPYSDYSTDTSSTNRKTTETSSTENEQTTQESNLGEEDSGIGSLGAQMSEDVVDGPSPEPSTSSSSANSSTSKKVSPTMCRVCFLKPETGLFVHLHIAHKYGCYSCAKKIWYNSGSCPICRRKIFKVAKLFS